MDTPHATNALRKAQRAVTVLETVLIPRIYTTAPNHHQALTDAHEDLFGDGPAHNEMWEALGIAVARVDGKGTPVTFDTSREFIESELRNRIRETDTDQRPTDPFDIFGSNESGQN